MGSLVIRADIWSRSIKKDSVVPKVFGFLSKTKKAPAVQAGFSAQFTAGGGLINYWLLPSPGYVPLGGTFLRLGGGVFLAVDAVRVNLDLCYQFEFTTAGQRGYVLVPLSVRVPFTLGGRRKK